MTQLRASSLLVLSALLALGSAPAVGQIQVDLNGIQRLPPATAALVLRSARAADPPGYDLFREQELARLAIPPDSVRRLIEQFASSYDLARATVRGGRAELDLPALAPLLSGPPHVLLDVRRRFALREDNPLDEVVNEIVTATLDTATTRLLRPLTVSDVQRLAGLQLERADGGGGPLQSLVDAQTFLNNAARSSPEWQSLDMEHQRRLLRALQIRAADATARGANAVAAFQQLAGAEANTAAARVSQAIDRARQVIDVSDQLRALEVNTFQRVVQEREGFEQAVARFRRQIAGPVHSISDVRERAALATLIAGEVGSDQLREAARRIDGLAAGVQAIDDLSQSLDRSRTGMMAATRDYAVQARTIFEGFATTFGIPSEKQQRVIRTLETVAQIASIGTNVAAGNYAAAAMQAIPLVSSFFGKKSSPPPDVEQLRFEALQAQLGVINQKLDSIASWQLQTMARLDSLRYTVDSLGVVLAQQHVEVLDRIDALNRALFYAIGLSDDGDRQALGRCSELKYFWEGEYSWQERTDRLAAGPVAASIHRCLNVISDYLPELDGPAPLDNLRMLYVDVANTENMQLDRAGVPGALRAVRTYYQHWLADPDRGTGVAAQRERLVAAFAAPTLTFAELNTKYTRARSGLFPESVRLNPVTFSNPLAESVVLELVRRLLEVHALYPLQKADGSLRTLAELSSLPLTNAGSEYAESRLRSALYLLDAAIAYQTLLGGDLMLPALAEDLYRPKYPVASGSPTVRDMLGHNATLASNVVRHVLYQAAANRCAGSAQSCVSPQAYQEMLAAAPVAGQTPALVMLSARQIDGNAVDLRDVLVHENGRWHIAFGSLRMDLPSPDEFTRGAYEPTPGLTRLSAARDAVVDALAGYEMFRRLADRRDYSAILLYQ